MVSKLIELYLPYSPSTAVSIERHMLTMHVETTPLNWLQIANIYKNRTGSKRM